MSLVSQVQAGFTRVAQEVKAVRAEIAAKPNIVVIEATDTAPPAGTPAGTIVIKKKA